MKTRWLHNLLHKAGFIDDGALLLMTFIDMVLTVVFFIACSIDVLTMIALIALGLLIPIIKVRAWLKLKKTVAIIWACVTFFAGVNFMLTTITVQDEQVVPAYVTEAKVGLKTLQDQQSAFRTANQRTNANAMQESIDKQQTVVNAAEDKASKEISHVKALSVFGRIPELFNPSAESKAAIFIALIFYAVIFFGFESTIGTIALEMGRLKPEKETAPVVAAKTKPKRKRSPKSAPKPKIIEPPEELFEDPMPSLEDYRDMAVFPDGSVRVPEDVAKLLKISDSEANRMHGELFSGYVFKVDRYVRNGGGE